MKEMEVNAHVIKYINKENS